MAKWKAGLIGALIMVCVPSAIIAFALGLAMAMAWAGPWVAVAAFLLACAVWGAFLGVNTLGKS